jgi:hypothetical protein
MTLTYISIPDEDLDAYRSALCDRPLNRNSTTLEILKYRYIHLNDKWRNNLARTLWAFRDELDDSSLTWRTFNHLAEEFDLNPNSITSRDIDHLFDWIN